MAFIPTAGTYRISIEHQVSNTPIVNVIAVQYAGAGSQANADAVVGIVADAWAANVMPVLSNTAALVRVTAVDQTSDSAPTAVRVYNSGVGGGLGGQLLPLSAACVVTLRTMSRGRSRRGRLFLAPFTEEVNAGGVLTLAHAQAVGAAVEAFKDDVNSAGVTWGVLSLYSGGQPRPAGVFTPITAVQVRSAVIGHQRRRQRRP